MDALVPGLLARGDLYIDAAPPESAKTYRSVDFAMSAAFGRKWGGHVEIDLPEADRRVAFLALEDWRGVRDRMLAWATHEKIDRADLAARVKLFGDALHPFTDRAATAHLLGALAAYKPAVVVISTFGDFMDGADPIKDQDVRAYFVRTIRTMQRLLPGTTIYVEAHMGKKNNDVLAGQSLRAAADLMTFSELDKSTRVTSVTISKAPKHFARPTDPIIFAAEPQTVTYFADGTLKTNLVYRKAALRVRPEEQKVDEARELWTAIVRAHHDGDGDVSGHRPAATIAREAAALLGPEHKKTAKTLADWVLARDKAGDPVARRYRERLCKRSTAPGQHWQCWIHPQAELARNLTFVLDGREYDPLLDPQPSDTGDGFDSS